MIKQDVKPIPKNKRIYKEVTTEQSFSIMRDERFIDSHRYGVYYHETSELGRIDNIHYIEKNDKTI